MAPPRFFKIFLSHFSSESMVIPASYYDELPLVLPKTALLQGSGGCFWKVAMIKRRDEVYFGQGWAEFVEDNSLTNGDVMTFVYDGSRSFKVSINSGSGGCREARAVAQVIAVDDDDDDDDKEDSVCTLSSEDTNASSEPEIAQTVPNARNQGRSHTTEDSTIIEPEMPKRVPRTRNKGKKRVVVVDSDDSFISEDSDSLSDSSYSPSNEDTLLDVTPKVTNSRKKGESRSVHSNAGSTSNSSRSVSRKRHQSTIKNPEVYLDDPNNVCFETIVKNKIYELTIPKQVVKDYCLKFQGYVCYIDNHKSGTLEARAALWQDDRVSIKKWERICNRNGLKKGDRLLCELFRKDGLVYAIKVHILNTTS